jgi:S-adenosylmethionine decarboxylase proenzyme
VDGLHITADFRGCRGDANLLVEVADLRALCLQAVADAGLQAVGELFHAYPPPAPGAAPQGGITAVVLLAESHLAIHTWPEFDGVTLDIYVCNVSGDNAPKAEQLLGALVAAFQPRQQGVNRIQRGAINELLR